MNPRYKFFFIDLKNEVLSPPDIFPQSNVFIFYKLIFVISVCFLIYVLIVLSFPHTLLAVLVVDTLWRYRIFVMVTHFLSGFIISLFIKNRKETFKICFCFVFVLYIFNSIFYTFIMSKNKTFTVFYEKLHTVDHLAVLFFIFLGCYTKILLLNKNKT